MVQDTIHALVLSVIKYGETSLITNCFTLEYGLQSYMLKGILSKGKKPLSKSLFEPLALLELKAPKNKEGKIGYIKEAKLLFPYSTIPFDLRKKALVFFLAEVLQQVGREEQEPNPALFNFLKKKYPLAGPTLRNWFIPHQNDARFDAIHWILSQLDSCYSSLF